MSSAISGLRSLLSRNPVVGPGPKKEPESRRLIRRSYHLWGIYQAEPTPERGERLELHLGRMRASSSKRVGSVRKEVRALLDLKASV
jgi:hypothetical protein